MRPGQGDTGIVEGVVDEVVDDCVVDVRVQTIGGNCPRRDVLRIRIAKEVLPRPDECQYTADCLRKHFWRKRVHCVVRQRDDQLEAIEFYLTEDN